MKRNLIAFVVALLGELLLIYAPSTLAVPSYSRRYGMETSGCHTMWGSLNGAGVTSRLTGYRAIFGRDPPRVTENIEVANGVAIPSTLPLAFITGAGVDSCSDKRETGLD